MQLAQIDYSSLLRSTLRSDIAGATLGQLISGEDLNVFGLLPVAFTLSGILLLLYLLYGGISLMLARDNPRAVEAAREKITGALVGFMIVFTAYWLVQIVGRVLNIQQIRTIFSGYTGGGGPGNP